MQEQQQIKEEKCASEKKSHKSEKKRAKRREHRRREMEERVRENDLKLCEPRLVLVLFVSRLWVPVSLQTDVLESH